MTQPSEAPGAPTDAGLPGQAPVEPQQQGTAEQAPPEPQDISALPEWAQKLITDTRGEAAKHRNQHKDARAEAQAAQAQRDKVLAALGLAPDGAEQVDPDKLGAQLEHVRAQAWETAVENKVLRMAPRLGIDADSLLDSLTFLDSLTDIDPDSQDFAQQLEAHVTGFVTTNPKFKTAERIPGKSGGDFGGAPGGQPASLEKQIADATEKRNFNEVIRLKRLKAAGHT